MTNDISAISQILANAMSVQNMRVKVAASNIASLNLANTQGLSFDYKKVLSDISAHGKDMEQIKEMDYQGYMTKLPAGSVKLDEQTLEAITASGRYQGIAEMLSRSYGIMQLAIQGRDA
jgi:flagellar basal body rod protein FlgB